MSDKKLKVLFFLPSSTGGAERMTVNIGKMLPQDRYEVKFVIVQRTLGQIVKFIPEQYGIIHIPIRNIYSATTLRMIRLLKREKPDFVFCSLIYLNVRLLLASKICNIKAIVRNNSAFSRVGSNLTVWMSKKTYRFSHLVLAQQEEMREEILKVTKLPAEKVRVISNPLDTKLIDEKSVEANPYTDSGTQVKFVTVGRFGRVKGQDLVVKALQMVRKKINNAHLYLVGDYNLDSAYDKSVKEYVEENGLTEYVHFIGFDTNPYKWVKNCNCYVLPSRSEGLPNALIDAMYLGVPVVATKCIPVISRIVKDNYNGILVESEDIEGIADGMEKALKLREFAMTYKSSSKEDIISLFN